eukprot:4507094-Alexandrium_andersonii.AAC.1
MRGPSTTKNSGAEDVNSSDPRPGLNTPGLEFLSLLADHHENPRFQCPTLGAPREARRPQGSALRLGAYNFCRFRALERT